MKINGKVWTAIGSSAATLAIVACTAASSGPSQTGQPARGSCDQNCDLQNMNVLYPDWYQVYMDVDGHPNVGVLCVGGGGIMTTTRDQSNAAAQVFPALDAFCKTQIGSKFSVTGKQSDEPQIAKVP